MEQKIKVQLFLLSFIENTDLWMYWYWKVPSSLFFYVWKWQWTRLKRLRTVNALKKNLWWSLLHPDMPLWLTESESETEFYIWHPISRFKITLLSHQRYNKINNEINRDQYNITLLPNVSTVALGMFCDARFTHHTLTPSIKHYKSSKCHGKKSLTNYLSFFN